MTTGGTFQDPRMRGFRSRTSVDAALDLIAGRVTRLGHEMLDLRSAAGRVLAVLDFRGKLAELGFQVQERMT